MTRTIALSIAFSVCLTTLTGCESGRVDDPSSATSENGPLSQIGALYVLTWQTHKKAPASLKDWNASAESMPEGIIAVRNGDVVVVWDVKLDDLTPEATGDSADEVLAYQKEVPESGGYVLMKNRRIKQMTADEFKAAPKAKGRIEEPKAGKSKSKAG